MSSITKFVISQILGIGAAITIALACQEISGTIPLVIPMTARIATSLYTITKL